MTALATLVSVLVLLAAAGYRYRAMRKARAHFAERRWRETL